MAAREIVADIEEVKVKTIDLLHEAQRTTSTIEIPGLNSLTIKSFHLSFHKVTGPNPKFSHFDIASNAKTQNPFFGRGIAYLPSTDEIYTTSDVLPSTSSSTLPAILISRLQILRRDNLITAEWTKLRPPANMPMPSGLTAYKNGILYCSQGTLLEPSSGGLFYMAQGRRPVPVVTNYYGRPFNSIQGVVQDREEGGLWFTDSCAGYEMEIRPEPRLPCHVYWFHPATGEIRVVADDVKRPTGVALDPEGNRLYVTDTEAARPGNESVATSAATIYAYDVVRRPDASPFLVNKHVFAFAFSGVPVAVTCDPAGNVYAACADGVEVWNSGGTALGLIQIPGGCSSLSFGRSGELLICGGQNLWIAQFGGVVFSQPDIV